MSMVIVFPAKYLQAILALASHNMKEVLFSMKVDPKEKTLEVIGKPSDNSAFASAFFSEETCPKFRLEWNSIYGKEIETKWLLDKPFVINVKGYYFEGLAKKSLLRLSIRACGDKTLRLEAAELRKGAPVNRITFRGACFTDSLELKMQDETWEFETSAELRAEKAYPNGEVDWQPFPKDIIKSLVKVAKILHKDKCEAIVFKKRSRLSYYARLALDTNVFDKVFVAHFIAGKF